LKIYRRILLAVTGFLMSAAIIGCADTVSGVTKGVLDTVLEEDPPEVVITINAAADINPDISGRPSPIVVRIYSLKSDNTFNNADFFAIYEKDSAVLGDTMTSREELEISPGDSIELEKEFDLKTTHVGVVAAYRDLDNAVWRGSIETPLNETTYIDVELGRLTLSVTPGKKKGGFFGF
jgi:type VI secretion system protein VasD